ncbi:MAG: aldo/keto reductase [Oscillospiraceae bacterium]|nr:aldo/keto reductase [Oscillospiraceae bacterium]
MENRMLTLNNGVEIPQLGLGVFRSEPGAETAYAVSCALEAGYRHIDTAAAYRNEKDVAQGIKDSDVPRSEIFITSKLSTEDIRAGNAQEGAKRSLGNLQTDYIDLYLIHWPCPGYAKAYETLQRLYEEKKFRAVGVSNFEVKHLDDLEARGFVTPAVNQIELHPTFRQKTVKPYSEGKGILIEAWSPLGGRDFLLVDHPVIAGIAQKHGKTGAQILIRWHIEDGNIVIPKSVKKDRIKENADVFGFALDAEDMAKIAAMDTGRRSYWDPNRWE